MGPHGEKAYFDFFKNNIELIQIVAIVELPEMKEKVETYVNASAGLNVNVIITEPFTSDYLPSNLIAKLDDLIRKEYIDGVIISSEASTHFAYAKWALDKGLSILVDKPIVTDKNVVNSFEKAKSLADKMLVLYNKCQHLRRNGVNILFSVNTQRRFHPGYIKVRDLLSEITELTGCGVTNLTSCHADGQLRTPEEILSIDYHGFNSGYGKLSHSGYHFIDMLSFFMEDGIEGEGAYIDKLQIDTSFVMPSGYLRSLSNGGFSAIFGDESFKKSNDKDFSDYEKMTRNFGEIDASLYVKFFAGDNVVANAHINLLHNSFSNRSNIVSNQDLYYGNGRVKHEWHQIYQGPFQNIQIHSYKTGNEDSTAVRINNTTHFDVHVYRHPSLKVDTSIYQYTINDFIDEYGSYYIGHEKVKVKSAKQTAFAEFISALEGNISISSMQSDITKHLLSNLIFSAAYMSHNLITTNRNERLYIIKDVDKTFEIDMR